MLELRPICEHCATPLPPDSAEALICSFECTFCHNCAGGPLQGVCPNCGGNFCARPVRPRNNLKDGNHLGNYPASTAVKHRPVELAAHDAFAGEVKRIPPQQR